MKILHITKKYPNALGGDAVAVSNLEAQQLANGDDVVVLSSNCDEIIADERHYKFGLKDTPAALDTITPRRLVSLGALVLKSYSVIRKERPDVVHTHSIDMAFAASFATRKFRIPLVHTFHILTFPDKHHGLLRRKSELLFLKGARPQAVTAPNETDVAHLKRAGVKHVHLLTNGIDLAFWKRQEVVAHSTFTFITAARLESQKGLEYLIRATSDLRKKTTKPFKLIIVGEGSLRPSLELLSKDLMVNDIVAFVGNKTPTEVRSLYAASDAMVIPSLWESGPLTSFEAWAMKLPLVITPVGMFASEPTTSKRALVVPLGDHNALANPMEELLLDENKRASLVAAGYEAVQQHTWGVMAAKARAIYQQVSAAMAKPVSETIAASTRTLHMNKRGLVTATSLVSVALLAAAARLSPSLNTFATLPLAVFVPGLLLLLVLWPRQTKKPALMVALATALGLLFVALESAGLNWLFPLFGIQHPLQTKYLTPLAIATTALLLGLYLRKSKARDQEQTPLILPVSVRGIVFALLPLMLPLLIAAGAFRQNNGASNLVTLIGFGLTAVMALWYVWKPKLWNASWLLFNISLGLLFATSLRSWYIGGFDISQEFQVYSMTLQQHYWSIRALPGNAYNACLSLTTLPVALQQFTHVGPAVIFKFFYQVVFALTGVLTYLIGRRFIHRRLAFLAALLYVVQAQFIDTMPQIVRQEVGFLFFGLLVYYLFDKVRLTNRRKALILTLCVGMVVMHYSTTYIAILILGVSAILIWASNHLHERLPRVPKVHVYITPLTLLKLAVFLLLLSTLWYVQINDGASDAYATLRSAAHLHVPHSLSLNTTSTKAQVLLGGTPGTSNAADVTKYADSLHLSSVVHPASVPTLPVRSAVGVKLATLARFILSIVVKLLLPISPIILLLYKRTKERAAALSYMSLGAVAIFLAVIILPALSASYNFQRVYQQCLIILGITGLWALWELLPRSNRFKTGIIFLFTIGFFLFSPGSALVNQIVGGSAPRMTFNNYGEEYDQFYVRQSDVLAASWLGNNCHGEAAWADDYATLRLTAYGGIPYNSIRSNILSAQKGCLYLDYANVHDNLYYAQYKKLEVRYTTPAASFARYDLVYSNGQAKVYQY
jgi:uncharacterized membrane protein/glycosyltransferase involved in cell wall biosynthesis